MSAVTVTINLETADLGQCVAAARHAEGTRQFDVALRAWEVVRARFPAEAAGHRGAGLVLRELRRLGEAETLLADAVEKFPDDQQTCVAHAWVAHSRGDFIEADRRWQRVRNYFPNAFDGYFGGGAVLCALRRFDEADVVYRKALELFPVSVHLLGDFAAVPQARGDAVEAEKRWNVLHTLFPENGEGYVRHARALRSVGSLEAADHVLRELQRRFPGDVAALVEYAYVAEDGGNWPEALKRWDAVVAADHGLEAGYVGAASALTELGRFADAETVLQPALRMFPDSLEVVSLHARIAQHARDYTAAASRWEAVRARFAHHSVGYSGGAAALLAAGRCADAAAVLDTAQRLFPQELDLAMEHARMPDHLQDWAESVRRWGQLIERFADYVVVKSGFAESLLRAGRLDDAEREIGAAMAAHRDEPDLYRVAARCAMERRDFAAAEARWRHLVETYPNLVVGWAGLGEALRSAGNLDEADRVIGAALERFPANFHLERQAAFTATARRDWPAALARWAHLKMLYPANESVLIGIADALWHARQDLAVAQTEVAGGAAPFEIPPVLLERPESERDEHGVIRELLMGFESIGDTCEFGMVQRRFGADPISLLRWTSTPPALLVTALETHFAGVGEAEHTVVGVSEGGEYTTMDRRYHMFSHTFTPQRSEPIEKFTQQHLKRMQFLRRKLLDDLVSGEKIFVYKCDQGLSDEQAHALFRALRRYGGNATLLCVRLEQAGHPCGTLRVLEDGLFLGAIDRFSTVDIHVAVWVELCRQTRAAWQPAVLETRAAS